jgi:hypothetical protein
MPGVGVLWSWTIRGFAFKEALIGFLPFDGGQVTLKL